MKKVTKTFAPHKVAAAFLAIGIMCLTACPPPDDGGETSLAVTGVLPSGAGAAISGNVVIVFSKAMDATVNGTVQLNDLAALSGGTWNANKKMYSIPYSDLARNTEYTVKISGFKDASGKEITANSDNKFKTINIQAGLYSKTTDQITAADEPLKSIDKSSAGTVTTTYKAAIDYAKANPKDYTLLLDVDVSITGGDDNSTDATMLNVDGLTLRLEGLDTNRTISLLTNGRIFTVGLGSKLILGANITLKGKAANTHPILWITQAGRVDMYKGAAITGNTSSGPYAFAGGVYVYDGTFTMEGGSITGNKGAGNGGGVTVSGTFTMLGGEISGNEAGNGGGVSVNGNFYLMGGSITGNTANGPNEGEISGETYRDGGGGVSVVNRGNFIMTGGSITNNTANKYGGGVRMFMHNLNDSPTFTMYRGTISGNTAKKANSGGGVYLYGGSSYFYLNSPAKKASVSGNFAPANTDNQVVTEEGGQITGSDSGNAGW